MTTRKSAVRAADPSQPLPHVGHELFACLLATGGMSQSEAYARAIPSGTARRATTLKANATRLAKTPAVAARIIYLRQQHREELTGPSFVTPTDVSEFMARITAALSEALTLGEEAGAAPQVLVKLRKLMGVHIGRLGRLKTRPLERPTDDLDAELSIGSPDDHLPWCRCPAAPGKAV